MNPFYQRSFTFARLLISRNTTITGLSLELKQAKSGHEQQYHRKNIALIFKDSTRTRCAFKVAFDHRHDLSRRDSQIGQKESIKDTARVLGRLCMMVFIVVMAKTVEILAKYADVPV